MATKRKLEDEIKLVLNSKSFRSTTNKKSKKVDLYSIKQNFEGEFLLYSKNSILKIIIYF